MYKWSKILCDGQGQKSGSDLSYDKNNWISLESVN